jgi:hypothetical protein
MRIHNTDFSTLPFQTVVRVQAGGSNPGPDDRGSNDEKHAGEQTTTGSCEPHSAHPHWWIEKPGDKEK